MSSYKYSSKYMMIHSFIHNDCKCMIFERIQEILISTENLNFCKRKSIKRTLARQGVGDVFIYLLLYIYY